VDCQAELLVALGLAGRDAVLVDGGLREQLLELAAVFRGLQFGDGAGLKQAIDEVVEQAKQCLGVANLVGIVERLVASVIAVLDVVPAWYSWLRGAIFKSCS